MAATLMAIERETAPRLGPYEELSAAAGSTQSLWVADALASTATPGDRADLYLLRRGLTSTGAAIGGFVAGDRVRLVKLYDPDGTAGNGVAGSLLVDRPWQIAPVAGEAGELHALHPANELRVAVLRGLDTCYYLDRVPVALLSTLAERDLTAALPWLDDPTLVYDLGAVGTDATLLPYPLAWTEPFGAGGRVFLAAQPDPYPDTLVVTVLRPASSVVNGLAVPPTPAVTVLETGGSLPLGTVFRVAVAARTPLGTGPASVPAVFRTSSAWLNTQVARLRIPPVPTAYAYEVSLSVDAAPKFLAVVTEAERAAGCTITAQGTTSAVSPGAHTVDARLAGVGAAAVQATGPVNDADTVPVHVRYAAACAHAEAWRYFRPRLAPVATRDGYPGQEAVARERGREAFVHVPPRPDRVRLVAGWVGA